MFIGSINYKLKDMILEEFVKGFAEQFEDTDITEIQMDTVYQDLDEWSSLTAMSIIYFVKTTYNKEITCKEIRSCETVEELFNLVEAK